MKKNKVLFGKDLKKVLKGMAIVDRVVGSTMGAAGKQVGYRSDYSQRPVATNDGITAAKLINLEDETEQFGVEVGFQAAERTNEEVGDATSTAIVLNYAMCEAGLEKVLDKKLLGIRYKKGVNAMVLGRQMRESVSKITDRLKEMAKPIKTDEELFNIANISMENPVIAKIISDSVKKVGENGIVLVEESAGIEIERVDVDGFKFDKGYVTPYSATNFNTMESVLNDTYVLVTNKTFNLNKEIFDIIETLNSQNVKTLLIICSGMGGEILSTVITNRRNGVFNCVAVEKPHDENVLQDIATLVGAELITNENHPADISGLDITSLGKVSKAIITKDSTLLIGGVGDKTKIEDRIAIIKKDILETESPYAKERFKERLAKLTGGVVILKVGAPTEADMKYMKLKVDDAVAATRAALEEGVVIGGGKTLYDIGCEKPTNEGDEVVKYACRQPMAWIMKNAGFTGKVGAGEVFNALTNRITTTPIEDGIVDPAKAERCALKNSVSSAATFIAEGTVIIEIPHKNGQTVI